MFRNVCVLLLASAAPAFAQPTLQSSSEPHPGIRYELWTDTIPARLHVVRIDLTSQELALYATKESDRGLTTSGYAARIGAQVAINGDAFKVAGYVPRGLAIGDSAPWTNTADDATSALLHLRRVGDGTHERTVAAIAPPEVIDTPATLPDGTQGAIAGRPLLVRTGSVETDFDCDDPVTVACQRAPRSAVAISESGNTMFLVTVDGWQQGSIGMTAAELASFLKSRGAYMAMALDGGSSATLVLDGDVASSPSDGVERTVANHLAIKYGALPTGQLVGIICKHDVIACRDDSSLRLPGAEVRLDDGRVDVVGADAFYDFPGITPRLACVTVKKDGFLTKTQCQVVSSGNLSFNSVALEEGMDPPDAGPSDGGVPGDAADPFDAGVRPDGGQPETGGGGGCCDAGARAADHPLGVWVLSMLVGFMLLRRRGTTG
ncbi:MAG TPA: phosphodiester glycosidase family protein [Kofleriaceae bacterium]|nr:phosphodiester glycosidase family protein [Kofleriaceae bacterium]